MFVILVYDVNAKRVARVHKICRKYLTPVQKSVFEGEITQKKLNNLQKELKRSIDTRQDSICIYEMDSVLYSFKLQIGCVEENNNIL